jgi:sugar lactone lactonase YvrE
MRRFRIGWVALLLGALTQSALAQGNDDLIVVYSDNAGTVMRVTPAGVHSTWVYLSSPPLAIATDAQGNFYISAMQSVVGSGFNSLSQNIIKVDKSGKSAVFATINSPPGWLAFDGHGILFVSSGPGQLYKVSPDGAVVKVDVHFPPTTSYIPSFSGLAFDDQGNLFASDGRDTIYKINPASGNIATFVSGLNEPIGLAFDSSGMLYVANNGDNTVSRISTKGVVSLYARVADPGALAFDSAGNLFVANTESVSKVNKTGAVTQFFSDGRIYQPTGLAFAHAITLGKLTSTSSTDNQPSRGLMFALSAPAVIFVFGMMLWLVFRKREEE